MEDDDVVYYYSLDNSTDLDHSFTSLASSSAATFTATNSSARSSLARSSLTLSFNDRLSTVSVPSYHPNTTTTTTTPSHHRPHRRHDPHWSAIRAATNLSPDGRLHLRNLKLIRHLGTGNLGRVFLCRLRDSSSSSSTSNYFALKVVDRDLLSPKKLSHAETEAKILSILDHPFLPTLYARIDASHYTCLLIDYCPGGDLHSLLHRVHHNSRRPFPLPLSAVRFYAAEVLVALEYLHAKGIVYRDLKPENILLRDDGHIMLSDFDLCFTADVTPRIERRHRRTSNLNTDLNHKLTIRTKRRRRRTRGCGCFPADVRDEGIASTVEEDEVEEEFVAEPTDAYSKSCVGTHEYLAPELVSGNGHGNGVDWWAYGVLIYELIYGTTPFKGVDKEATLRNISSTKDASFPLLPVKGGAGDRDHEHIRVVEKINRGMEEARDLIKKLLEKDQRRRLGCVKGATEIKAHPFFNGVKWPLIRETTPPEVVARGNGSAVLVQMRKNNSSYYSRSKSGKGVVMMSPRRKWWWKGLISYLMKSKDRGLNKIYSNKYVCISKRFV